MCRHVLELTVLTVRTLSLSEVFRDPEAGYNSSVYTEGSGSCTEVQVFSVILKQQQKNNKSPSCLGNSLQTL